ncbi:MAG: STAS domain-containing protein [Gammaproteobacteria bacterium]|nr:STAS domain-containing protein [Gammaproteobacteria bacterium]
MSEQDLIKDDPFDWIDEMAADAGGDGDAATAPTTVALDAGALDGDGESPGTPEPAQETTLGAAEGAAGAAQESGIFASTPVRLPAQLTREAVPELKVRLAAMLAEEEIVLLEGDGVSLCDTAGLQLLAAFFKTAERDNVFAGWHGASAALREDARTLGLESMLALEDA